MTAKLSPLLFLMLVGSALMISAPSTAAEPDFEIQFNDSSYIRLPEGARSGLTSRRPGDDGTILPPSKGTLRSWNNEIIGRFTVIFAGELDAMARIDELALGTSPGDADHAAIDNPEISFLTFEELSSDRYFAILTAGPTRSTASIPAPRANCSTTRANVAPSSELSVSMSSMASALSPNTNRASSTRT